MSVLEESQWEISRHNGFYTTGSRSEVSLQGQCRIKIREHSLISHTDSFLPPPVSLLRSLAHLFLTSSVQQQVNSTIAATIPPITYNGKDIVSRPETQRVNINRVGRDNRAPACACPLESVSSPDKMAGPDASVSFISLAPSPRALRRRSSLQLLSRRLLMIYIYIYIR